MRRAALLGLAVLSLAACAITERAATTELPGTSWQLVDLDGTLPVADAVPTLNFDQAGAVNGSTGCNTYNGEVSIDGNAITFGPLATTMMACADPDADAQERAFTAAIEDVDSYTIDDEGRLVLQGGAPLTFEVASVSS
jgi:heat shock protein HslJ